MQRVPPEVTYAGEGEEPPHWSTRLDGNHLGHQHVFGLKHGRIELRQNARGGTDVHIHCKPLDLAHTKSFEYVINAMRGLRAVLGGRPVFREKDYALLDKDGDFAHANSSTGMYFAASLAPGSYVVEQRQDQSTHLFWKDDIGTTRTEKPQHEFEVMRYYERYGIPVRVKRKKLQLPTATPRKPLPPNVELPPYVPPEQRLRERLIERQVAHEAERQAPLHPRRRRLPLPAPTRRRLPLPNIVRARDDMIVLQETPARQGFLALL